VGIPEDGNEALGLFRENLLESMPRASFGRSISASAGRSPRGWASSSPSTPPPSSAAACLQGRWHEALDLCEEAERLSQEHGAGVVWELNTARAMWLVALYWMGRFLRLTEKGNALLAEARTQGDLYLLNNTLSFLAPVLAASNPEDALEQLQRSIGGWTHKGFHVQHFYYLQGRVLVDLYCGNARAAWQQVLEDWPALARSWLLYVQNVRVTMVETRARCALAVARMGTDVDACLRSAERDARRMERENVPWAFALAALVRAQLVAFCGNRAESTAAFEAAIQALEGVEMRLYAAAARRRLGEILAGPGGEELMAHSERIMTSEKVVDPPHLAQLYVPWGVGASDRGITVNGQVRWPREVTALRRVRKANATRRRAGSRRAPPAPRASWPGVQGGRRSAA